MSACGCDSLGAAPSAVDEAGGFDGHVVVEVNTRRAVSSAAREADLAEALAYTRLHLAPRAPAATPAPRPLAPVSARSRGERR